MQKLRFQMVIVATAFVANVTCGDNNYQTRIGQRYLKGAMDEGNYGKAEERGADVSKAKSLLGKTPNISNLKTVLGKKAAFSKMEIPAGRKLDLTQLKTPSGRTIDLTKVKTTSRSKMDINHLKNAAIKDPDLSSVSSLVGKNPTKLSSKEVEGVQSFLKKHPKDGLNTINLMFGGGVAALFLLLFGSALVITFQAVFTKH